MATQHGSTPKSLAGIETHVVMSIHLSPSAETTVVLRKSDLREVGRIEGWPAFTIPPSLVVFTRSMVHFAPAHPASLGVFDLSSGVERPLYPSVSAPYTLEPEESLTPARKAFRERLRPIYLAWEKADGPRAYGYDPAWFDVSHSDFRYDQTADRLTFAETMTSRHPASIAPPLTQGVSVSCAPMLKFSRVCVEDKR
jgi:hypothetical protein